MVQGKGGSVSEGYHLSRRLFVRLSAGAVAATALPIPKALGSERGGGTCDPFSTPPSFQGIVPTPEDVLGFPIGVDRETTADEINTYLDAVGAASPSTVAWGVEGSRIVAVSAWICANPWLVTFAGSPISA